MTSLLCPSSTSPVIFETITEERLDEMGRRVITTRKIQKKLVVNQVSETIASRRSWSKFGEARSHPVGPNTKTTLLGEPVFLSLAAGKDFELEGSCESTILKMEKSKSITCRYCQGSHWSSKCPYKDQFASTVDEIKTETDKITLEAGSSATSARKYIPPSLRTKDGASSDTSTATTKLHGHSVRVTNLPANTTENDLWELFQHCGKVSRVVLPRDQSTHLCKGFAFVSFYIKSDAERAISMVHKHNYGNFVLNVEPAKYD